MSNADTQAPWFKESPDCLFKVPRKQGAFQRAPCLLWYLSACWKAAARRPLGSLRWRIPNSPCQASINISFVLIVHYARDVTCVPLCCFCWFLFCCFSLSGWRNVVKLLHPSGLVVVVYCFWDKIQSWFACSPLSPCSLSMHRRVPGLSAKLILSLTCSQVLTHDLYKNTPFLWIVKLPHLIPQTACVSQKTILTSDGLVNLINLATGQLRFLNCK